MKILDRAKICRRCGTTFDSYGRHILCRECRASIARATTHKCGAARLAPGNEGSKSYFQWYYSIEENRVKRRRREKVYRQCPLVRRKRLIWMAKYQRKKRRFFNFLRMLANIEMLSTQLEEKKMTLIPLTLEKALAHSAKSSSEDLKRRVAEGMRLHRNILLQLAADVVTLEARGEKVEADHYFLKMLRNIGSGKLLVDVVVRFAGAPLTIAFLKKFPAEKQQEALAMSDAEISDWTHQREGDPELSRINMMQTVSDPKNKQRLHEETDLHYDGRGFGNATLKDAAEKIVELIYSSSDPPALAAMLLPKVQEIKNEVIRKPAQVG